MSTLQHEQVKSQKQHLQILWGRGAKGPRADIWGQGLRAKKNKYPFKEILRNKKKYCSKDRKANFDKIILKQVSDSKGFWKNIQPLFS